MSDHPSTLDINDHEQHDEQQSCDEEVEAEGEDDDEVTGASGPMGGSLQRLLQKEGPDARNVVSWLVPNLTGGGVGGSSVGGLAMDARSACPPGGTRGEDSTETSRERDHGRRKSPMTSPFKSSNGSHSLKNTPGWRGRASDSSTQGFNQRLWGYLFRNVNRAVDELYYLCEAEGSATHCREAAELLESCRRDFNKLVERIADQTRFEEEQRAARAAEKDCSLREGESLVEGTGTRKPKGLVWEVRKTTSASGASAIVLNAIERMESHAAPSKDGQTLTPSRSAASSCLNTISVSTMTVASASPSTAAPARDRRANAPPSEVLGDRSGESELAASKACMEDRCRDHSVSNGDGYVDRKDQSSRVVCAAGSEALVRTPTKLTSEPTRYGLPREGLGVALKRGVKNIMAPASIPAITEIEEPGEDATATGYSGVARSDSDGRRDDESGSGEAQEEAKEAFGEEASPDDREERESQAYAGPETSSATARDAGAGALSSEARGVVQTQVTRARTIETREDVGAVEGSKHGSGDDETPAAVGGVYSGGEGRNLATKAQQASFPYPPRVRNPFRLNPCAAPFTFKQAERGAGNSELPAAPSAGGGIVPGPASACDAPRVGGGFQGPVPRRQSCASTVALYPGGPGRARGAGREGNRSSDGRPDVVSGACLRDDLREKGVEKEGIDSDSGCLKPARLPTQSKWSRRPRLTPSGPIEPKYNGATESSNPRASGSVDDVKSVAPDGGQTKQATCFSDARTSSVTRDQENPARGGSVLVRKHDLGSGGITSLVRSLGSPASVVEAVEDTGKDGVKAVVAEGKDSYAQVECDGDASCGGLGESDEGHVRSTDDIPNDGAAADNDCEDPDSVYMTAMEQIWAEAEALVDAEAQAEEEAWARLPKDVPCPPGSEGFVSDGDPASGRHAEGDGNADPDPDPDPDPDADADADVDAAGEESGLRGVGAAHHSELEIEIPGRGGGALSRRMKRIIAGEGSRACSKDGANLGAAGTRVADVRCTMEGGEITPTPVGGNSLSGWYRDADGDERAAGNVFGDDEDQDEVEDEKVRDGQGHEEGGAETPGRCCSVTHQGSEDGETWDSPSLSASRDCDPPGESENCNRPPSEGSSGASTFGNDRGTAEAGDDAALFAHRELQKKLSSPQRKPQRKLLSLAEAKLRQERRQMLAEHNRAQLASGMAEKLKQHEERARGVRFRKEEQILKAEEEARRRMQEADARRMEHRRGIVRKANDANSKVEEVLFMNKLTVEDLKITLQMKLAEVERRIQSGRERRQQLLAGISDRQRKRMRDKAAQMSEKRLEAESAAAMRWEALQKRLEAVQERCRDRERETRRRMQAANRHHLARERREAMLQATTRGEAREAKAESNGSKVEAQPTGAVELSCDGSGEGAAEKVAGDVMRSPGTGDCIAADHGGRAKPAEEEASRGGRREVDDKERSCGVDAIGGPSGLSDASPRFGGSVEKADAVANGARASPVSARDTDGYTDGSTPIQGSNGHCKGTESGRETRDDGDDGAGDAVRCSNAASGVVGGAATDFQRRGRARKKRARKIKDKMRQLCIERATSVLSWPSPTRPPLSVLSVLTSGPAWGVSEMDARPAGAVYSGVSASRSSDGGRAEEDPSERPKLERVMRELAELVLTKARVYREATCAVVHCKSPPGETSTPVQDASKAACRPRGSDPMRTSAGPEAEADGSPSWCSSKSKELDEGSISARGVNTQEEEGSSTAAEGTTLDESAGTPAPSAGSGIEGIVRVASRCHDVVGAWAGQDGSEARNGNKAGGDGQARRHKKTRRGKRAGGGANRRRGAKEKASRRGTREVAGSPATVEVLLPVEHANEMDSIRGEEESAWLLSTTQRCDEGRVTGVCEGWGRETWDDCHAVPLSVLEGAAVGPLRDLVRVLSSAEAADPGSPRHGAPDSGLPVTSSSMTACGLGLHLRQLGILDSLVLICAPFPWVPVGSENFSLGSGGKVSSPQALASSESSHNERHCGVNDAEDSTSRVIGDDGDRQSTVRAQVLGPSPSNGSRSGVAPFKKDAKLRFAGVGKGWGRGFADGADNVEGKYTLTATALRALARASEDFWCREHLLAIDGAAPLVDCVRRAMEREVRCCGQAWTSESRLRSSGASKAEAPTERAANGRCWAPTPDSRAADWRGELECEAEEVVLTGLVVLSLLVRHVPSDDACARIQDELVRYILATRVLSELLHLVASLAAKCEGEVTGKAAKGSLAPSSGSSCAVVDYRLVLRLIEGAAGFMGAVVSFSSCPVSGAPCEVAPDRLELRGSLVQPTTGTFERPGSTEHGECTTPEDGDRTRREVLAEGSDLLTRNGEKCANGTGDVDTSGAMAPISGGSLGHIPLTRPERSHGHGDPGGFVSSSGRLRGSLMTTPRRSSPVFCQHLAELSDGSLAAQPARARIVMDAPEVPDVIAMLVSLLASMTAYDGRRLREVGESVDTREAALLSDDVLVTAAKVIDAVNQAFMLDFATVQGALSAAEGVRVACSYVCEQLLASIVLKLDSMGSPLPDAEPSQLEEWLSGVIRLLGYFSLGNVDNQGVLHSGPSPTILVRLCNLPLRYFTESKYQEVLFPTLISICHENSHNRDVADNDFATDALGDFLRSYQRRKSSAPEGNDEGSMGFPADASELRDAGRLLSQRIPMDMWNGAIKFFTSGL